MRVWLRWFVVLLFVVGSGLFFVGLYLTGEREDWLGLEVLLVGAVLLLVVLDVVVCVKLERVFI